MTIDRPSVSGPRTAAIASDNVGDYSGVDRRTGPQRAGKERRQRDLGPPGGPAAERRGGADRRLAERRRA